MNDARLMDVRGNNATIIVQATMVLVKTLFLSSE
jgi:hypothetical protein